MKKILLSAAVIFGFLIYSVYEKNNPLLFSVAPNPTPAFIPTPALTLTPTYSPSSTPYLLPKNNSSSQQASSAYSSQTNTAGIYKDGTYTGSVEDAFYGNVQIQATIHNGRISGIEFLQYPSKRDTSILINSRSTPILASEAIQAQNAEVDLVSGATFTSKAFIQSLNSALSQAM